MSRNASPVRLFVNEELRTEAKIRLSRPHSIYLTKVMRRDIGDVIYIFNGKDGEWEGTIIDRQDTIVTISLKSLFKAQPVAPDLQLLFAPVKRANVELMLQKTTELGITSFIPILTANTDVVRLKSDRLISIAREASEQSRRLTVPEVGELVEFSDYFANWSRERVLFVLDQRSGSSSFVDRSLLKQKGSYNGISFFVGPEGGLTLSELYMLRDLPFSEIVSLGSRILRTETAAIAAISIWQAICGEWYQNK